MGFKERCEAGAVVCLLLHAWQGRRCLYQTGPRLTVGHRAHTLMQYLISVGVKHLAAAGTTVLIHSHMQSVCVAGIL